MFSSIVSVCLSGLLFSVKAGAVLKGTEQFSITLKNPWHSVPLTVYYPSDTSSGPWDVLVFLHGFECSAEWYSWLPEYMAPLGYIVAMPNSYEHGQIHAYHYASDMRYTLEWLMTEANVSFPLMGKVGTKSMAVGHSAGGGSAVLACSEAYDIDNYKHRFDALFVMSPAVAGSVHGEGVKVPSLLLTGTMDCINAPKNTEAIYEQIASSCKLLGELTNGTHCHWMNAPSLIEGGCDVNEKGLCQVLHPFQWITMLPLKEQLAIGGQYLEDWTKAAFAGRGFKAINDKLVFDKQNQVMAKVDRKCN